MRWPWHNPSRPNFVSLAVAAAMRSTTAICCCFAAVALISIAGRGKHSHVAKAAWWGDDLFCLEVREWYGGRAVTFDSQVRKFPGRIDLYRTNPTDRWPEYDRARAITFGCGGWPAVTTVTRAVLTAAMLHLPIVRLAVRAEVEDGAVDRRPPFCSQACTMADRVGRRRRSCAPPWPIDSPSQPIWHAARFTGTPSRSFRNWGAEYEPG